MDSRSKLLAAAGALCVLLAGTNVWQWTRGPAEPTRQQILDGFAEHAFLSVMQNQWFGVKTWQNPMDVWVTQEILWEVKPDFVVETGTFQGGSAILWSTLLEQINPGARIVTVDIEDNVTKAREHPLWDRRVDFLVGSSTAPEIVAEVKRIVGDGRVLVILDSDHSRDHVLRELELYAPLVSVGSYVIVQDTSANGHPLAPDYGPGPWEAVDAFMAGQTAFEIDRSRERLLFTLHPRGYLRRVR